jgi:hypothetical protein
VRASKGSSTGLCRRCASPVSISEGPFSGTTWYFVCPACRLRWPRYGGIRSRSSRSRQDAGGRFFWIHSRRLLLVGLVLPIAILRNGFRVWLLATLSVNVDPQSSLHRRPSILSCHWLLLAGRLLMQAAGQGPLAFRRNPLDE